MYPVLNPFKPYKADLFEKSIVRVESNGTLSVHEKSVTSIWPRIIMKFIHWILDDNARISKVRTAFAKLVAESQRHSEIEQIHLYKYLTDFNRRVIQKHNDSFIVKILFWNHVPLIDVKKVEQSLNTTIEMIQRATQVEPKELIKLDQIEKSIEHVTLPESILSPLQKILGERKKQKDEFFAFKTNGCSTEDLEKIIHFKYIAKDEKKAFISQNLQTQIQAVLETLKKCKDEDLEKHKRTLHQYKQKFLPQKDAVDSFEKLDQEIEQGLVIIEQLSEVHAFTLQWHEHATDLSRVSKDQMIDLNQRTTKVCEKLNEYHIAIVASKLGKMIYEQWEKQINDPTHLQSQMALEITNLQSSIEGFIPLSGSVPTLDKALLERISIYEALPEMKDYAKHCKEIVTEAFSFLNTFNEAQNIYRRENVSYKQRMEQLDKLEAEFVNPTYKTKFKGCIAILKEALIKHAREEFISVREEISGHSKYIHGALKHTIELEDESEINDAAWQVTLDLVQGIISPQDIKVVLEEREFVLNFHKLYPSYLKDYEAYEEAVKAEIEARNAASSQLGVIEAPLVPARIPHAILALLDPQHAICLAYNRLDKRLNMIRQISDRMVTLNGWYQSRAETRTPEQVNEISESLAKMKTFPLVKQKLAPQLFEKYHQLLTDCKTIWIQEKK